MSDIDKMTDIDFAKFFSKLRDKILDDPVKNFVKAPGLINFTPTPGQTVLLKVIFGQPLDNAIKHSIFVESVDQDGNFQLTDSLFTEQELYRYFTGFEYTVVGLKKYNKINMLMGRRGGKSTLASIIALYSAIKVNWKPFLRKTPVATVAVLSHSVEFSQEILDILRNMVEESPVLSRLKDKTHKDTQTVFHLKVPFIREDSSVEHSYVAIKIGAASKKTTRGRAVCTALMDEMCWWQLDESSKESDNDIIRALRPALLQFGEHGTLIKLSSPAIKMGVMYEEWVRREELREEYIQMKAPSWMMNTILPKDEFKKEWKLDPDGFNTEFRAEFVDSVSDFILSDFIDMAIMRGISFLPPSDDNKTMYSAAIDAAFKGDRFAFAVVGYNEKRVTTYVVKYWEGSKKDPVKVSEVAAYIRTICKDYGLNQVVGDQYSFQPLRELFLQFGINLVENTFTLPYKRKIYFGLKRLIHNHQIDLLDIPLLHKELKELVVEQTSSGQIRVGHQQNGTDDLSDALAVATYHALEKAGVVQIMSGEIAMGEYSNIPTDSNGRSFLAPSVELLQSYRGFSGCQDNSSDYIKDPKTGNWVKRSEVELADSATTDGPAFSF